MNPQIFQKSTRTSKSWAPKVSHDASYTMDPKLLGTTEQITNISGCLEISEAQFHAVLSLLRHAQQLTSTRNSRHFMQHDCSLPCSQQRATCPYPEPDESSPRPAILEVPLYSTITSGINQHNCFPYSIYLTDF